MKSIWFGTFAAVALLGAGAASAAEPARSYNEAPPPIRAPIFNWTGFYVGANVGYGSASDDNVRTTGQAVANVNNVNGGARPGLVRIERDGIVGGGQVGYNWQMAPNYVLGIETDIAGTDLSRTVGVTTIPLNGISTLNNNFTNSLEYLGTLRGRLGYAWDASMLYATGGLAYGEVNTSANFFGPANAGGVLQFTGARNETRTGYTVGGGIEHMLTPNVSVKGEYLYYDLGRQTVNVAVIPGSGGGGTGYDSSFRNSGHTVRIGLNYKFGSLLQ